ncbi:hypothetical protein [Lysobacter sp. Hz 25]|uniref:hypothetical protein n=1 Tax=Lysobacter sp. Hz 25 TaxID=3383698 RepID=UPI0038D41F3C
MHNLSDALFGAILASAGFAFVVAAALLHAYLPERERALMAVAGTTNVFAGLYYMGKGTRRG